MSITRHHNDRLSLVPISGPLLSLPVLAKAFAQGLDAHDADQVRRLHIAFVWRQLFFPISEPARREVLARLLKLNQER